MFNTLRSVEFARRMLLLAIVASLLSVVSDLLLLYDSNGNYLSSNLLFYKNISFGRMLTGHFLGVFFIPLQLLGLIYVFNALRPSNSKWLLPLAFLCLYMTFPGVGYHATCVVVGMLIHNLPLEKELIDTLNVIQIPFGAAFILGIIIVSVMFSRIILTQQTDYPKWMAYCTPLTWIIVSIALYLIVPIIGNFIVVAAFNFSFLCFFILSAIAVNKSKK